MNYIEQIQWGNKNKDTKGRTPTEFDKFQRGVCEWECATCNGPISTCTICGRQLCEYHIPKHLRIDFRNNRFHY